MNRSGGMKKKNALRLIVCLLLAAAVLTLYFYHENTALEVSEYALGGAALFPLLPLIERFAGLREEEPS